MLVFSKTYAAKQMVSAGSCKYGGGHEKVKEIIVNDVPVDDVKRKDALMAVCKIKGVGVHTHSNTLVTRVAFTIYIHTISQTIELSQATLKEAAALSTNFLAPLNHLLSPA